MEMQSLPEIQRVGVAQVILELLNLGVDSAIDFPYISAPTAVVLHKVTRMMDGTTHYQSSTYSLTHSLTDSLTHSLTH